MVYFKKISAAGKYHDELAIPDVIAYITRADKTPSGIIIGSHVDMAHIAESMISVSKHFGKYSKIRLHHFILSFHKTDIHLLPAIAQQICNKIGPLYQVVAAQHEDTLNPHLHVVFNAVSHINGYKYRGGKEDYYELFELVESIVYAHGLLPLIALKYVPLSNNPHE